MGWVTDSAIEQLDSESTFPLCFSLSYGISFLLDRINSAILAITESPPQILTKDNRRPYLDPKSSSRRIALGVPFVQ